MKNVALPTKFHLLLRSILALTSAVAIASAACAETMAGDAAVGVSSPAVGMNQHGLTGTGYQPAMSGQGILPTAHGAGINLHQDGLAGWWYDPRTSGQGFFVQGYPDLLALGKGIVQASWLTYDDVVGGAEHQRWYTLSGTVVSGQTQVALTIYQNTGGNFNAPPITTAQPIGTATLSFDSCTSGELTYNLMGRASTIALTRLMQDVLCSVDGRIPGRFWRSGDYSTPQRRARASQWRSTHFQRALLCLDDVCAERRGCRTRRTALVHRSRKVVTGQFGYGPRATLREHRRSVRPR